MKKIIVPVDFSKHSEYALAVAAKLAKQNDGEIIALHMLELSENALTSSASQQQQNAFLMVKMAEKRFQEFIKRPYLEGITITPVIKHFKVFKEVNNVAQEHNADMIVIGSHGASGAKELFLGSNTERVVRYSDIPVLVIKEEPKQFLMENVVFACDFSEASIRPYINAKKLFTTLGAQMHLLYVNTPHLAFKSSTEMEQLVATFLQKADGNLEAMDSVSYVNDYTVEEGVFNYANAFGVDVISVATHGRKGIAHFLEGSISEDIANHAALPVMTFKI